MRAPRCPRRGQTAHYHCMSRTVNGQFLFRTPERQAFRSRMRKLARFLHIHIHTYTVLSNHWHIVLRVPNQVQLSDDQLLKALQRFYGPHHPKTLQFAQLLTTPNSSLLALRRKAYLARMGDLSTFIKELKEGFSKWFNAKHQRFGTLWAERFNSVELPSCPIVLARVCAYVDLNAVRAGLARRVQDYPFCGYAEAVAGEPLARDGLAFLLPQASWPQQQAAYQELLAEKTPASLEEAPEELDPQQLQQTLEDGQPLSLGQALRMKVRYFSQAVALGPASFVAEVIERRGLHRSRKRPQKPWPMEGAEWGGLTTLRRIKKPIHPPKAQ